MCYEDVKIALRRYVKYTANPGSTVALKANSKRVLLRLSITLDGNIGGKGGASPGEVNSGVHAIVVNGATPNDELTLERHGTAVMGAFFIFSDTNMLITEVFDDRLEQPPEKGDPYVTFRKG